MNVQKIRLTSAEIASLWTLYMNDSMSKCILGFMLKYLEDDEIKPAVQYSYDIVCSHIEEIQNILTEEKGAIPKGFTDEDVNMNAPWLYSDIFCLTYVNHMVKVGLVAYSGFVSMSSREDIREFFITGLRQTSSLYDQATSIAIAKGVHARHPYIDMPKETDYIDSKNYLSGLNPFNNKRPLNAIEISHLYMNILTNNVGLKLGLSFAQTSPLKEVQQYMIRGKEIAQKHIKVLSSTLLDNDIQIPHLPDISISDSTTQTFSDKLVMYHFSLLISAGIGNYATAAAASQRSDLALNYERLSLETAKYAKAGADIMIKHSWLEQPPGTIDRTHLAKYKEKS